jgi:hypothetical protein
MAQGLARSTVIADLTRQIAARRQVYDRAFDGDLAMLAKIHGEAPVREALKLLDKQRSRSNGRKRRARTDDTTRQYWLDGRMPTRGWPRLTT